MPDANDMDLVREYAARNSEPAFETLVRRHVSMVYSVALRQTGDPAQAEEITQAVFLILARKAARLRPDTVLPGWLHETARFASASFLRGELRRQRREQEAYAQSKLQESTTDPAWEQLAPLLDEAIGQLGKTDRNAVVLRFFQNKSAREIAAALNVHESAAQKRLNRAVEKLRAWFLKRGVAVSADALTGALLTHSVQGAPAHLAASVMAASAKGTAVSSSTLTLIKGALKIMAWTKAKTVIVAGVGLLLTAAMTGTFVTMRAGNPPLEPTYQNKSLRQWIAAEPSSPWGLITEDIWTYRRTALLAMGEPAIRYLRWMIAHPQQTFGDDDQSRWNHGNLANVVVALELIGPAARAACPDLVRLWEREDKVNPIFADYNGFPLVLAKLGDASPEILDALHRHFNSPDPQHSALCAFAAWRLNPNDTDAISFLRRVMTASDGDDFTRYSLLDTFWQFTTNSTPFLPEIRKLIDASTNAKPYLQVMAANAAWHILQRMDTANALIRHLGAEARKTNATVDDVSEFVAAALDLRQVPGVAGYSMPVLGELGLYKDASTASFATNILDRLKRTTQGDVASPP